ncbi:hypothetical protein HN51_071023 [Arachis hypogaea]
MSKVWGVSASRISVFVFHRLTTYQVTCGSHSAHPELKKQFGCKISSVKLSGMEKKICEPPREAVVANASVVKSGRNLTVVALDFKLKKTENSVYICHSTYYNMPASSL